MKSPAPPVLDALRAATTDIHANLERMTFGDKIMNGTLTSTEYERLLQWQQTAHLALEPMVSGFAGGEYTYRSRFATHVQWAEPTEPRIDPATAIGILYVLEGSSLGGSLIYRKLQENPALTDKAPFAFYRDQAEWGLKQWRAFLACLSAIPLDPAAIQQATGGARAAFSRFEAEWLALA